MSTKASEKREKELLAAAGKAADARAIIHRVMIDYDLDNKTHSALAVVVATLDDITEALKKRVRGGP